MPFRSLSLLLFVCVFSACAPKVDASSTSALITSVAKVEVALNKDERERFTKAFATVAFGKANDTGIVDLVQHADQIVPDAKAAVHGKTAKQIMLQAASIERRHKK